MTVVQVSADVVSLDPVSFQGQQGVSAPYPDSGTETINFVMVPDTSSVPFPSTPPSAYYGTAMDGSGGTAYLVGVALTSGKLPTTTSVPVTVTVVNNPPSKTPLPPLTITILLEYSGNQFLPI